MKTLREFYEAVVTANASEEITAFAKAQIEKMDATNEKRKNTPSKTAVANAPLMDKIATEILTGEAKTASDVAEVLGVKVQKASALLRGLVKDGRAIACDVKVPKKGVQKGYTLAPTDAVVID